MTNIFHESETWVAVGFLIFVILIVRLGWHRVIKSLDSRAENIKKDLNEARSLREEAQSLLADYQRKKRDSEKEADEIIALAKKEAENIASESKKKLQEILQRRIQVADEKIELARTRALQEARNITIDVAIDASERLIKKLVDDSQASLIADEAIAQVDKLIDRQLH